MPFIKLEDIKERELVPGYFAKFIHSENMTFSQWEIEAGSKLPEHSHRHEQISCMIEGEFFLTIGNEEKKVKPGMVSVIPANEKHSGKAITNCKIIDVFYPIREDYT